MLIMDNLSKLIKESFNQCTKDSKLKKYFIIIAIFQIIILIITNITIATLFSEFLTNVNNNLDPVKMITDVVAFFGFILILVIISSIVMAAITYLTISQGLKLTGKKSQDLKLVSFVKFIFIGLFQLIFALLSIFNLKMLAIPIAGIILILIGILSLILSPFIGGMLVTLGTIALIFYFFVFIYNLYRLIFIEILFIEKGKIISGLETSWRLTNKKVFDIFIATLIVGIIIAIVAVIFDLPATLYSFAYGFSQALVNTGVNPQIAQFGLMTDPIYLILLMPAQIVYAFYMIFINIFFVNMYNLILKEKTQKK